MNELFARLKSETPKWFKRIMLAAVTIGGSATAAKVAIAEVESFKVSPTVDNILTNLIVAGLVAGAIANTACKTPPTKKKKEDIK